MIGKDFEDLLKKKGYNATEAIAALGCSRPHYYDLLKKDVVPDHWVKSAKSLPEKSSCHRKRGIYITVSDRIKMLRKTLALSQAEFGQRVGLSQTAVAAMETGRSMPSGTSSKSICTEFSVNEQWLLSGKGEMLTEKEPLKKDVNATISAMELIDRMRTDYQQQLVEVYELNKYLRELLDECRKENAEYKELLIRNKVQLKS